MKKLVSIISLLVIVLSACNLPATAPPTEPGLSLEQQAATVVSQTLTAVANNVPLASPTAGKTEQPLASPTGTAPTLPPTVTPTAGTGTATATTLTVDSNTNCREGPGLNYKIVIVLVQGTIYQIIARTADNKYWNVTQQNSPTSCWVLAEFSNAFGDVTLLPVTTPSAPTSSVGSLQAPALKQWNYNCSYQNIPGNILILIEWTDRSNNETGFRVYLNGTIVVDLPANTTTYSNLFTGSPTVYNYSVSAYNETGEALMSNSISFSCQ